MVSINSPAGRLEGQISQLTLKTIQPLLLGFCRENKRPTEFDLWLIA